MIPIDWSRAHIVKLLPAMDKLHFSESSLLLMSTRNAAKIECSARAYLAQALDLGLAPAQCFPPELSYGLPGQGNIFLHLLLGRPGVRRAALVLVEGGASPWPHEVKADGQLAFSSASRIAREIFLPRAPRPEYVSELLMRQAVLGLADLPAHHLRAEFISACLQFYNEAVSLACSESSGVRGPADAAGLRAARLMMLHGPKLACNAEPPLHSQIEAALAGAHAFFALKTRRPEACADPHLIKASLTPDMATRLRSLRTLLDGSPEDEEGVLLMLNASSFLRVVPLSACVAVRGAPTLLGAAARGACGGALEQLAVLGADPWLASSQEGCGDAFLWLLDALLPSPKVPGMNGYPLSRLALVERCLEPAASLLAGPAPGLPQRAACARLAAPVALFVEEARARGESTRADVALRLWTCCERLCLIQEPIATALTKSRRSRLSL